jgi:hypothetical protein
VERLLFSTDTLVISEFTSDAKLNRWLEDLTHADTTIRKVEFKGAYKPQYETLCHAIWAGHTAVTYFKCSVDNEPIDIPGWTHMLHFVVRMTSSTVKTVEICGEGWNVMNVYVLLLKAPLYKCFKFEARILARWHYVFRKRFNDEVVYRRVIRIITDFVFACDNPRSVKKPFVGFPVCLVRHLRGFLITSRPVPIIHVNPDFLDILNM